jgi:hypothetical protein
MPTETMHTAMANADKPGLGVGLPEQEPIGCDQGIIIDFKITGFNVDRDDFAVVIGFDLRSNLGFVQCLAALGKFFFAIARLTDSHGVASHLGNGCF